MWKYFKEWKNIWHFLCWHSFGVCLGFVGVFFPLFGGEPHCSWLSLLELTWNFLLHVCSSSPSLSSNSLILSVFSPYCPCPLIVPSGLVAVARAVFTHPEWKAEVHQGSNSPSALGIEEMHGSMAGIPEPPESKETPEWWVKMVSWDRTGLSPFAEGTVMVFSVLGVTAMSLPTQVMRMQLGLYTLTDLAGLGHMLGSQEDHFLSTWFKRKCFTIPLMKTYILSLGFWLRYLWEGCIEGFDQSVCGLSL